MSVGHWWDDTDREHCSTGRNTCPSGTLYAKNITWTDLGSNPGLHDEGTEENIEFSGGGSDRMVEKITHRGAP
jgi:hypothetical protein